MTISYSGLVGTREAPDQTIRALLENNWNNTNTRLKTPKFQSDSEEPDFIADDDSTAVNLITVRWLISFRDESVNEPNGDTVHHWKHRLAIGVWGENMSTALLLCDEINRILWTFAPLNATRLDKSDGSDSEADYFERTEIDFERVAPQSLIDNKPSFEGILEIHFRKIKT